MGGEAQEQAPRAGPKAAGRLGKHQPTQPVAEGAGLGVRRLQHVGTWAWLRLNQGQGPTSVDTPRGSPRNEVGKNDCASSLEADCTDALQRKRQEGCSFRRPRGRGNSMSKPIQGLLFSEAKKPYAEAVGHGRRSWCAWVWSPLPPGLSKEPGER